MPKKTIIGLSVAVLVLILCAAIAAIGIWQIRKNLNKAAVISSIIETIETPTSTPVPVIERTPVSTSQKPVGTPGQPASTNEATASPSSEASSTLGGERSPGQAAPLQHSTEQLLTQAILPERDQRQLAIRLKNNGQDIPKVVSSNSPSLQVGDQDTFWVTDNGQIPPRQFQVDATLNYITDHSYWWVEDGYDIEPEALKRSAEQFETDTYPTNRAFFGSEWTPGIDGDVRVHIFLGDVPGVAGYFSASNSYAKLAEPYSNEREMFFINARSLSPGTNYFDSVLAHEFQHMIHWHQDRNEDTWINEGMSELASFINNYGPSSFVGFFMNAPDTQLNNWSSQPADYGGSFLFMAYFLQRYGEEMTKAVVANPQNGVTGFDEVLEQHRYEERFDDIFADFLVANYLNNTTAGDDPWGYEGFDLDPATPSERHAVFPVEKQATVYQYGGDYIEITGTGNVTVEFTGSTKVKVVDSEAHSGSYQWYSHRGDDTNTRLTRLFDLRDVDTATLNYWTWYDIEADWDYGYVEVSTDGGKTWSILNTPSGSTSNPSGNAFGPGYTGKSDDGPAWIEERIDLSPYAGQEILVRFEYVTDDAVNQPGWTIDDINIPEIGFSDDVEGGLNGWQAEGFVRIDNVLSQKFLVQLLEIGDDITVRPLALDDSNYGSLTIEELGSTVQKAILIISGTTPITTEPASYQYSLSQ